MLSKKKLRKDKSEKLVAEIKGEKSTKSNENNKKVMFMHKRERRVNDSWRKYFENQKTTRGQKRR